MQLTATRITLPTNDWKIQSFKEMQALSEETLCFSATLVHVPTKAKFTLRNDGHGGSSFMQRAGVEREPFVVAEKAWDEFVEACRPVLRESVAHEPQFADLYDDLSVGLLQDAVIDLFVSEASVRKQLSKAATRACVREPEQGPGEFYIYNVAPEVLKRQGTVKGEYWDKAADNWVAL